MMEVVDSIKHPAVAAARRRLGDYRSGKPSSFLVEGRKLVLEALAAGAPLEQVFFLHPLEDQEIWQVAQRAKVETCLVTQGVYHRILNLGYQTSTRVLGTVRAVRRPVSELLARMDSSTYLLVGETIQDPRNLGVLVRTADAWGLRLVAFTEGSADPFARPSIRSSTGSILRVEVTADCSTVDLLTGLRAAGVRIVGTSAGAALACWDADLSPPCAIILGNETSGLSPEAREASDIMVRIPIYGGAHSYNITVAAGILLYEAARQRKTDQR